MVAVRRAIDTLLPARPTRSLVPAAVGAAPAAPGHARAKRHVMSANRASGTTSQSCPGSTRESAAPSAARCGRRHQNGVRAVHDKLRPPPAHKERGGEAPRRHAAVVCAVRSGCAGTHERLDAMLFHSRLCARASQPVTPRRREGASAHEVGQADEPDDREHGGKERDDVDLRVQRRGQVVSAPREGPFELGRASARARSCTAPAIDFELWQPVEEALEAP
jgi:hypothetical protein